MTYFLEETEKPILLTHHSKKQINNKKIEVDQGCGDIWIN